jgi:hypothetical protein
MARRLPSLALPSTAPSRPPRLPPKRRAKLNKACSRRRPAQLAFAAAASSNFTSSLLERLLATWRTLAHRQPRSRRPPIEALTVPRFTRVQRVE